MTDDRVYHRPLSSDEAINELRDKKETQFDPELVEVFISLLERGVFPKRSELESILTARKEK
jgi:HD-GYP domain-containing protein (c-di-GMP phosphodiesterase class II)